MEVWCLTQMESAVLMYGKQIATPGDGGVFVGRMIAVWQARSNRVLWE